MASDHLNEKHCAPCKVGTPALKGETLQTLSHELGAGWKIVHEHHLEKEYTFKNFREGLAFVNRIGEISEKEGHHPDIFLAWGKVKISIWTHKIDGLSMNDFILAAKFDLLKG